MLREVSAAVFLGTRRVGTLGYREGNTWFSYEDRDPEHPVLGQAFERAPGKRRSGSGSVPEWFANLLPERGSGLRRLVAAEFGRRDVHDFELLTYLGEDLPGAVRVVAEVDLPGVPESAETNEIVHEHGIRFSLAGVQPKFSMRQEGKGLTLPATGRGGDWIVKLPDRRFFDVPRNEYSMLTWLARIGLNVPEAMLVTGTDLTGLPSGLIDPAEPALAVRRFDRAEKHRVHQEDFAQMRETGVENKYTGATYNGLARVVSALCPEDSMEYVARLAAFIVVGNVDAHLKNWTLHYPDTRNARLSPVYDVVCVTVYPSYEMNRLAFRLSGSDAPWLITQDNFGKLAEDIGVDRGSVQATVRATVEALMSTWPDVKRECPVPDFVGAHVDERLRTLPLCRAN